MNTVECISVTAEHIPILKEICSDKDVRDNFSAAPMQSGQFERYLFSNSDKFLFLLGEDYIGYGVLSYDGTRAFFGYAIDKEYRGRGLAAQCLAAIEKRAKSIGIKTLTTNIAASNTYSIKSCVKAGFRPFRLFEKNII